MKALLIADNQIAIENISQVLNSAGYDVIVYKWLLKALDNIEEITPHLIIVSAKDYPRHWKTLVQFASTEFGGYKPEVILYSDGILTDDELRKAEALSVRGIFESVDVNGLEKLRDILIKEKDIYSGKFVDDEGQIVPTVSIIVQNDNSQSKIEDEIEDSIQSQSTISIEQTEDSEEVIGNKIQYCTFIFTNPISGELVSGYAKHFDGETFEYIPDVPNFIKNLDCGILIKEASIKIKQEYSFVQAIVEENDGRLKLRLQKTA
ncbi:MAG: response regulator [Treponema sp.]|nr:response regulator [Treponema sp.]MBP3607744.1 response regulator [Treponema sp.]